MTHNYRSWFSLFQFLEIFDNFVSWISFVTVTVTVAVARHCRRRAVGRVKTREGFIRAQPKTPGEERTRARVGRTVGVSVIFLWKFCSSPSFRCRTNERTSGRASDGTRESVFD
jgi:hypothetical protein